jgi:RHS repeat-associated protein
MSDSLQGGRRRKLGRRCSGYRPRIEALEDRTLLSTVTWLGGHGLDWDTGANWSTGQVPTASDDVRITQTGITITHNTLVNDHVNSLISSAAINLSSGSLELATAGVTSEIDATLTLVGGGLLLGAGNLNIGSPTNPTLTGQLTWSGGTMSGSGTTTIAAGSSASFSDATGGMGLDAGRVFNNYGALTWIPGAFNRSFTISHAASFTNEVGGVFNDQAADGFQVFNGFGFSGASFINAGTFVKSASSGTTTIGVSFTNTGSIDLQQGTMSLQGGGSSSGSVTVEALGRLDFQTTYALAASSSVTGQGTVSFGQSNAKTVAGTYSVGNTTVTGGEADFNSAATTGTLSLSNGTLGGTGTFTVSSGSSSWTGGTMSGAGTTVLAAGVSLTLGPNPAMHLDGGRALDNYGTFTWAAGRNNMSFTISHGASFTNEAGGVFNDQAGDGAQVFNAVGGSGASFTNAGTFLKSVSGTTTISVPFSNTGTINLQAGTLSIQGDLPLNGAGILAAGLPFGTVAVSGNLTGATQNAELFAPLGTVTLNGSGTASSPQFLEVMSQDEGNVVAGFTHNFVYNQLTLANNTYVRLVDNFQNVAQAGAEALYVNALVVPAGCTLDLQGLHVYVRQDQIAGKILNGSISQLTTNGSPSGGPLNLGTTAPGNLTTASQVDNWTFFGRAGQSITVVVNTGTAGSLTPLLQPYLNLAQVSLVDANSNVLATNHNTQSGTDVTLAGVSLPADGVYTVQVQGVGGSTGNYEIAATDSTTRTMPLNVNETVNGLIDNPYRIDLWTFSAAAGQQVQFNLVNEANPGVVFDLTGPNGYTAFTGRSSSSAPITLPALGSYVLKAYSTQGQTGAYAFRLQNLSATSLTLGVPYTGQFAGGPQAQLFQVTAPGGAPLVVNLTDNSGAHHDELYLKFGSPPTPEDYQYRFTRLDQYRTQVIAPLAAPGTWYVLLYNNSLVSTLEASTGLSLTGFTPFQANTAVDTSVTLTGAGFDNTTTVALVSNLTRTAYPATSVQLNSSTQLTATFAAGSVPAGGYTVRASRSDGSSAQLVGLVLVQGGQPANFVTGLVIPSALGNHTPATLYLNYGNSGDLAMPAPLLVVNVTQTHSDGTTTAQALMTLDASRMISGFYGAGALPDGVSHTIQVLGSGKNPGTLQARESVGVPIYWAGWQQPYDLSDPPFNFSLGVIQADDPTPVDWASLKDGLRPENISAAAWDPIFTNLTNRLGSTWGNVVTTLDADASYLGQLGENVTDASKLWAFEIQQAIGLSPVAQVASAVDAGVPTPGLPLAFGRTFLNSIVGRYQAGPLGFGWFNSWQSSLSVDPDGTVVIHEPAGADRRFQPDSRGGYFAQPGDYGTLTVAGNGDYLVRQQDGTVTAFLPGGPIDYVQDTNGNRITAGYNAAGQLTSLTHSSGQSLQIAYNSAGLIASITDSDNRTTTYSYDPTNQFLLSVKGFDGRTTSYSYDTSTGTATSNALLLTTYPDGTHDYFSYDSQGRLSTVSHDGGAEPITFGYGPAGTVTATDATGGINTLYFNEQGLVVKTEDALQRDTELTYDNSFNLVQVTDAAGQVSNFRYDGKGNLLSSIDPAGNTINFTYTGPFNELASYTDAKGNTTSYSYSGQGNLLAITYPNNSIEQFSYDPLGNLIDSINRRSDAIGYSYNTSGQLSRESFADGSHFDYTYDGNGNLITAVQTNADGTTATTTLAYDPVTEDLTQISYPNGRFLKFTYDGGGRRTQSVDQDAFTVNYQYNAVGQLAGLTDGSGNPIVSYTYDAAGRLTEKDLGNGTYTTYQYDLAGQLLHLVNHGPRPGAGQDGPTNSRFDYTYDLLGRASTMTTLDGQWTYTYDPDGQLTHAVFVSINPPVTPNQDLQYFYDAAGNRTQTILNGVTTAYTTNNLNEYTSIGSTNYLYDPNGNLISQSDSTGTTNYSYSDLNQLVGITSASGTWSYGYDPFSNRNSVTQNGQTTQYLIDPIGLGNIVGAYSGSSATHYTYGFGLIAQVNPTGTDYYDFDGRGSTAGLTGPSGTYVNEYSYLPFGEMTTLAAGVANPFKFVGELGVSTDGSQLLNMRARNYDVRAGHFTSEDPLGLNGGSTDYYTYANNSPLAYVDPLGLAVFYLLTSSGRPWKVYTDGDATALANSKGWITNGNWGDANAFTASATGTAAVTAINPNRHGGDFYDTFIHERQHANDYTDPNYHHANMNLSAENDFESRGYQAELNDPFTNASQKANARAALDWINRNPFGNINKGLNNGGALKQVQLVNSRDPNDAIGPAGFGAQAFVSPSTLLPYRIDFENQATATAPAQTVIVTNQLDPNLDWTTFQFTQVGFGDTLLTIPAGLQHYQTTVPLTENGESFDVEIELSLNPATGLVTATFQSINPNTFLPPDVLTGFLPPEDGTGRGKGYFSYTILPKAGLATGTQIRNVALVTFDQNPSIATDQVNDNDPTLGIDPNKQDLITIDAGAPVSSTVLPLPATSPPNFQVSATGQDDAGGSGIANFDIYVSDNGGPFVLWLSHMTGQATYHGTAGHTYGFFSVAYDNVGNRQAQPPDQAEATTQVFSMVATPLALTPVEGQPFTTTVATFTDLGAGSVSDYAATITWGDGSTDAGTITFNNGVFSVNSSHTYAEESAADHAGSNPYAIAVSISRNGTPAAATSSSAQVADAAMAATSAALTPVEGQSFTAAVATFTDPGGAEALSDYAATINWGDGSTDIGTITLNNGVFSVSGSHTYAEESAADHAGSNPYAIAVNISHEGAPTVTANSTATVSDPSMNATGAALTPVEGQSFTATVATFTDPGGTEALSDYGATITWGDGSTDVATITVNNGVFSVTGSHTYAEESAPDHAGSNPYAIAVTVSHDGSSAVTASSTATVSDPSVTATGAALTPAERQSFTAAVATFTDPGGAEAVSDYSATIAWGDGSTDGGTISVNNGLFTVTGSHTYAEGSAADHAGSNPYGITVAVRHEGSSAVVVSSTASVSDAAMAATEAALTPVEGQSFTAAVATFTDPGGAEALSDFAATIAWGDGSTDVGTITLNNGVFTVTGSHTYAEESAADHAGSYPYAIAVNISHESAPAVTANSTATVSDPSMTATDAALTPVEGQSFTAAVATFTDPGGAEAVSDYSATITWGDGSTDVGSITVKNGAFSVTGSHTYAEESAPDHAGSNPYAIAVSISHEGAPAVTASSTATVSDPSMIVTGAALTPVEGQSFTTAVATFTDPGGAELTSDYSATIAWGDGSSDVGSITLNNGVFSVTDSHTYAEESAADHAGSNPYGITVTVNHEGSAAIAVSSTATVSDASLSATGQNVNATESLSPGTVVVATFTDAGGAEVSSEYSATITWGDGSSTTGTIAYDSANQDFTVSGSHTYAEEGKYGINVQITHEHGIQASATSTATVADAALSTTANTVTPTAGGPFSGVVASFTDANPRGAASEFQATIQWGDGNTSMGTITANGSGGFDVSGANTYAAAGTYTITVQITDVGGSSATVSSTANVANLGSAVQKGQSATILFWHGTKGQTLIKSFNGGATATALGNWLATTFANLYGVSAGANNLAGKTNSQVAAFFQSLYKRKDKLDAQVLDTALDVYATTLSLGSTAASAYGFTVSALGLGASSYNVGSSGAAFGVANNTTLNVYQILKAANKQAVTGVLYNGNKTLRSQANTVFTGINQAGGIS